MGNTTLTEIGLSGNDVGDTGIVEFGRSLQVNHTLSSLYVNRAQITDVGAKSFFHSISENKVLENLYISENNITPIAFAAALASKNSRLSVSGQAEIASCCSIQ